MRIFTLLRQRITAKLADLRLRRQYPRGTEVTITEDDIGDEDCRKLVYDIYAGNTYVRAFSTRQLASAFCQERGWVVVLPW